jgi:hypothetical protein
MPSIECNLTFSLALRFVKFHGDCSSCSNSVRDINLSNNNNENFIDFFMHFIQLKISLLKVIYNWLLDTLYITYIYITHGHNYMIKKVRD